MAALRSFHEKPLPQITMSPQLLLDELSVPSTPTTASSFSPTSLRAPIPAPTLPISPPTPSPSTSSSTSDSSKPIKKRKSLHNFRKALHATSFGMIPSPPSPPRRNSPLLGPPDGSIVEYLPRSSPSPSPLPSPSPSPRISSLALPERRRNKRLASSPQPPSIPSLQAQPLTNKAPHRRHSSFSLAAMFAKGGNDKSSPPPSPPPKEYMPYNYQKPPSLMNSSTPVSFPCPPLPPLPPTIVKESGANQLRRRSSLLSFGLPSKLLPSKRSEMSMRERYKKNKNNHSHLSNLTTPSGTPSSAAKSFQSYQALRLGGISEPPSPLTENRGRADESQAIVPKQPPSSDGEDSESEYVTAYYDAQDTDPLVFQLSSSSTASLLQHAMDVDQQQQLSFGRRNGMVNKAKTGTDGRGGSRVLEKSLPDRPFSDYAATIGEREEGEVVDGDRGGNSDGDGVGPTEIATGWVGEWNRDSIAEVISALRELRVE